MSRHGPGMEDEGYICLAMSGSIAKIKEIGTSRRLKKNAKDDSQGFPDSEDVRPEDEGHGENTRTTRLF